MRLKFSKLSHYQSNWLLEHFVAGGLPARPQIWSALIVERAFTFTIGYERSLLGRSKMNGRFLEPLKSMSPTLAAGAKGNEGVAPLARCPSLAFCNVGARSTRLFADTHNHINGIENFGNQAKRHLRKYKGIPKHHFPLFLQECEWRFNYGSPKGELYLKVVSRIS